VRTVRTARAARAARAKNDSHFDCFVPLEPGDKQTDFSFNRSNDLRTAQRKLIELVTTISNVVNRRRYFGLLSEQEQVLANVELFDLKA
jgi:hypothetical protein